MNCAVRSNTEWHGLASVLVPSFGLVLHLAGCVTSEEHEGELAFNDVFSPCGACEGIEMGPPAPYDGPPPSARRALLDAELPWESLEGHLAWTSGQRIWIADAVTRQLSSLSFGATDLQIVLATPALAPDAASIAFGAVLHRAWNLRVFVAPVAGGPLVTLVAPEVSGDLYPLWSPDGETIYVRQDWESSEPLLQVEPDGSNLQRINSELGNVEGGAVGLSPDGRDLVVGGAQVVAVPLDGSEPSVVAEPPTGWSARGPVWSPDGTRLAFIAVPGTSSPLDIVVTSPSGSLIEVASRIPGSFRCASLAWSPSGTRLAYMHCTDTIGVSWELNVIDLDSGLTTFITSGTEIPAETLSWVP